MMLMAICRTTHRYLTSFAKRRGYQERSERRKKRRRKRRRRKNERGRTLAKKGEERALIVDLIHMAKKKNAP